LNLQDEGKEGSMAVQEIAHTATTTAGPEAVFALLVDGATWPTWSPLGSFELLEPGDGTPEGVGALRRFTTRGLKSTERVVTVRPNQEFSYTLLKGMPLRDYQATVTLTPVDGGTRIDWHSTFSAKIPLTGPIYRISLGRFIGRVVAGLAANAAKEQGSAAA
jgi:uncharacterized protein YndB with AHSA1/START domain